MENNNEIEVDLIKKNENNNTETVIDSENQSENQSDQTVDSSEVDEKFELERQKKLDFLLKQVELFSHFIANGRVNGSDSEPKNGKRKSSIVTRSSKVRKKNENSSISDDMEESPVKVNQFEETPSFINGEMRDYQIRALNWLISLYENGINGILADEMGLGKTLQTISMLGYLKNHENNNGPHLIIAPKTTVQNWLNEINRFCPSLRSMILIGDKESRADILHRIKQRQRNWDVLITSYEMILLEATPLKRLTWKYIVIDEAHRIKNENSKLSITLRKFISENRLLLTGTPLQNNLHELWSLLNYLLPDVFASSTDFDAWFDSDNCLSGNDDIVKRLHTILRPFMLRRIKSEVEKKLLPKIELKLFVGLTTLQRETYKKVLLKEIQTVNSLGTASQKSINNILMELRKAANHPYLIDGVEEGPPYTTDEKLVENCGKMMVLDKLLAKLQSQGSRVVLFTQFVMVLNLLDDYLIWRGYKYCRLDGSTSFEDRTKSIGEFNAKDSEKFIFILSTRAGGLGINLTTADIAILYDSDWNPQSDFQAIDRVHRIGQTKQVRVFRLITENTVDERIVQRAEIKRRLDQMVIQQGRPLDKESNAQQKGMKLDMIRFGAEHILSSNGSDVMDVDIDKILKDGELKAAEEDKKYGQLGENELRNLTLEQASSVSVYQFEGMDFRSKPDTSGSSQLDLESGRPARAAKLKRKVYSSSFIEEGDASVSVIYPYQLYPKQLYDLCEDGENLDLSYDTERKTNLLKQGFSNWTEDDFDRFCHAMYRFGRKNLVRIAKEIPSKTLDEVTEYHTEFWNRGRRILDVEDFEEISRRVSHVDKLLSQSLANVSQSQSNGMNQTMSESYTSKLTMISQNQIGIANNQSAMTPKVQMTTMNHPTVASPVVARQLNPNKLIASPKPMQIEPSISTATPTRPLNVLLDECKRLDESFEKLFGKNSSDSSDSEYEDED